MRPASSSGQTSRRRSAAIRAFASTDCGRSVEPVIVSRFDHHLREVELDLRPGLVRDHHQPPLQRQGAHVARQVVAADHVEDDVDAAPRRRVAHRVDEVGHPVVDGKLGAEPEAGLALRLRARRHEDPRAAGAGELDRGGADPRRAAVNEQAFARLEPAAIEDVGPDREEGLAEPRRRDHVERRRHRQRVRRGGQRVLGIAAARQQRADLVADLPFRDARPHCRDLAGGLEPGQVGGVRRRGVAAGALRHVGPVDAGRAHPDQDLAGLRLRHPADRRPQAPRGRPARRSRPPASPREATRVLHQAARRAWWAKSQ